MTLLAATALSRVAGAEPGPPGTGAVPIGVVVEEVQPGSVAELAGVRVGDVLVSWSQAASTASERRRGDITSPLLVADLEFGRLPCGPVTLEGVRDGAPVRVEVASDAVGLGLRLRPRLPQTLLHLYLRGRALASEGRVEEGATVWRTAVAQARRQDGGVAASCWLLAKVGRAWAEARQLGPAREAYDDAVACAEDRDPRWMATILEWQGEDEYGLGEPEVAAAAFEAALQLRRDHVASPALSAMEGLFGLVTAQRALGRSFEAREVLLYMLDLAEHEAPESLLVARVLQQIGLGQQIAGDLEVAEETFERAMDIADRMGPGSSTWARAQTALAGLLGLRGDLAGSEERFRQAMERHLRHAPASPEAARALLNLGVVAAGRGDLAGARHWTEAALRIVESRSSDRHVRAILLNNLGHFSLLQGDTDEAVRLLESALADLRAMRPGSWELVELEVNLSEALSARGDLAGARAHLEKALEQAERFTPRSSVMASTLSALGDLARREGDWDAAEECFTRALATMDALESGHLLSARALQGLSSVLRWRGDLVGAERHLRRAAAILDARRGRMGRSDEERSLALSSFHGVYRELIDLLVGQGRTAEAFEVLEASRARALRSMLAARDLRFDLDVPPEHERELRAVDAAYERAQRRLAQTPPNAPEAGALQWKVHELRDRQRQLDIQVRQASPRLAALREPQPLDAEGVAARLDAGTALIAYSVGTERTVAFALAGGPNGGLRGVLIPAGEDELRRRIDDWRTFAQASPPGRRFLAESRRLFALLLAPLAEPLRQAQRVVVSADGPLHGLPFAALRDERGFLAESKAFVFAPSGTVYAQQVESRASRRWGVPAAFGDPQYASGTLPALPGSRREVAAVESVFADTRTYVGREATEEKVKALHREARFVHLAVHGLVDPRAPLDSALAFSTTGPAVEGRDSGLLHAWEIFERVRIDADLVVLSACGSAAGANRPGEGIIGLTRAFTYAGARSVLASLWNVGDASTGTFMKTFYERWARGASKAEALRQAQVDAIRRGQRPLRWAAFQLYGDDR